MSSNCPKCEEKLGTYEYNRVKGSVVCDYCASDRKRPGNIKSATNHKYTIIKGHKTLKSLKSCKSKSSNKMFYLSVPLAIVAIIITLDEKSLSFFSLFIFFPLFFFFIRNRLPEYSLDGSFLIISKPITGHKKYVDLKTINQYKDIVGGKMPDQFALLKDKKTIVLINSDFIADYELLKMNIINNLMTLNAGKGIIKKKPSFFANHSGTFIDI